MSGGIGARPDENLTRILEYCVHQPHLLASLHTVLLVDADLINPDAELRLAGRRTESSQSGTQTVRDGQSFSLDEDDVGEARLSPHIGQSLVSLGMADRKGLEATS